MPTPPCRVAGQFESQARVHQHFYLVGDVFRGVSQIFRFALSCWHCQFPSSFHRVAAASPSRSALSRSSRLIADKNLRIWSPASCTLSAPDGAAVVDTPSAESSPAKGQRSVDFRGTRVPVSALFSNLEGGATIDEFMEWFPGVSREQVNLVLEHASRSLNDPVTA